MTTGWMTGCVDALETTGSGGYFPTMSSKENVFDIDAIVWRQPDGDLVSCEEKLVVLRENLDDIRQECQDALEDAILMGCDEAQIRQVLSDLLASLTNPYLQK